MKGWPEGFGFLPGFQALLNLMRRDGAGEVTDQQEADQGKGQGDAQGQRLHHAQGLAIVLGEEQYAGGEAREDENKVDNDEGF